MLNLFVATLLKTDGHFSNLGVGIALGHRHVEKRGFSRVKQIQQSTAYTFDSFPAMGERVVPDSSPPPFHGVGPQTRSTDPSERRRYIPFTLIIFFSS